MFHVLGVKEEGLHLERGVLCRAIFHCYTISISTGKTSLNMPAVPVGVPPSTTAAAASMFLHKTLLTKPSFCSSTLFHQPSSAKSGVCKASQVVELFPTMSPEVIVREARLEDSWEVAETHCSSFFPDYSFPMDFVLRVDRIVAMLSSFAVPNGFKRTCLVAVTAGGSRDDDAAFIGSEDLQIGGRLHSKSCFNRGYVTGILTVDNIAEFLPRKGPLQERRKGIAYVSNVAVREKFRRKGIAKKLILKAVGRARNWGCRAIALHCDGNNPAATELYKGQGFRCVKVPQGAGWPKPKSPPGVHFCFMIKLLHTL